MDREQTIAVWDGGVRMRVLSAGAGPRAEEWLLVCQSPGPNVFECAQSVGELRPFSVERGQPILQNRNLLIDVVNSGDGRPFQPLEVAGGVFSWLASRRARLANIQPDRGRSQGQSLRDHAAGAGQFLGVDGSRPPLRPHAAHRVRPDRDLDPRPYAQDSQRRLRSGRHRAARWRRLARRGAGRAIMAEV